MQEPCVSCQNYVQFSNLMCKIVHCAALSVLPHHWNLNIELEFILPVFNSKSITPKNKLNEGEAIMMAIRFEQISRIHCIILCECLPIPEKTRKKGQTHLVTKQCPTESLALIDVHN